MQDIENEVKRLIAEIVEKTPEEIKPETRFFEDLGIDSMMALEFLVAIERKYKISIPQEKLPEMRTLTATVEIVKEFMANKSNVAAP